MPKVTSLCMQQHYEPNEDELLPNGMPQLIIKTRHALLYF